MLARRYDHGFFEFVLVSVRDLLIGETQLVVTDRDDVTILQRVLFDQLAVDVSAVGAIEIFEKRIIENVDNQRMVTTDGGIVDSHIIVRKAPDRISLLRHVVFSENLIVQA